LIIVHFDVLANEGPSFIQRQPSIEGRRLWNALFEVYKGRVVVAATESTDLMLIQEWLKREGYKPSLIHIADPFARSGRTPRAEAVWHLASTVGRPHWYIDTDAACCADVLRLGIPSLCVAVPSVQRPEWHEKEPPRAWDDLVEEIEAQSLLKREKTWGDAE